MSKTETIIVENNSKCHLQEVTFTFDQEPNCLSSQRVEELQILVRNDLGVIESGSYFFEIRTESWAFDSIEEFTNLLEKIKTTVDNFKI